MASFFTMLAVAIPLFSEALAQERGPTEAPFIVTYGSGDKVLAFVGADHVFTSENSTIDAIRRAFVETNPSIVIVEGIPTALGPDFAPIVAAARRRDDPGADAFARSEAVFAASQALVRNVPFIGGEPTVVEEIDGLVAGGYDRSDVLFAVRLRSIAQARRSGGMPAGNTAAFTAAVERESRAVAQMTGTEPVGVAQFVGDYRRMVGVDPVTDDQLPHRLDPGTKTLLQKLSGDNMRLRDGHLLATILKQFESNDRVLVVYGSSHWTTLSRALEQRFGKPEIVAKTAIEKRPNGAVAADTPRPGQSGVCDLPAGFVNPPRPEVAPLDQLMSHTELIEVARPIKAAAQSGNRPLHEAIRPTKDLPGVSGTLRLSDGPYGTVGARRLVCLNDGSITVEEVLLVESNDDGSRFRYVVWNYTGAKFQDVHYGVGEIVRTALAPGKTLVNWTYRFALKGGLGAEAKSRFQRNFLEGEFAEWMRSQLERGRSHAEARH